MSQRIVISRRELAVGAIGMAVAALSLPLEARLLTTKELYGCRLRCVRRGSLVRLWVRVSDITRVASDIPVRLILSTDAASAVPLAERRYISEATKSHIFRDQLDVGVDRWKLGDPMFARIRVGDSQSHTRVWRIA